MENSEVQNARNSHNAQKCIKYPKYIYYNKSWYLIGGKTLHPHSSDNNVIFYTEI